MKVGRSEPNATWSAELYRIYGLTPEQYTPSYEQYLTMVHPDDRQRVIDATNRVFHEHVPYSHDERIFRPDGSTRYLYTWTTRGSSRAASASATTSPIAGSPRSRCAA